MELVVRRRTRLGVVSWPGRVLAVLLGVCLAIVGQAAVPAHAATLGNMLSFGGFHVGAFRSSNGVLVYCLEPGLETPVNVQLGPRRVNELRGYSMTISDGWGWSGHISTSPARGELLRAMNWVLAEHGQTTDLARAAEVQIALWVLRKEPGNAAWIDAKLGHISANGGGRHVERGIALAGEARRSAVGPSGVDLSGELAMGPGTVHGSGTVRYPAGTTEIRLVGAVFDDGTSVREFGAGGSIGAGEAVWTAQLHEGGWTRLHEVTASGDWAYAERFWPDAVILHPPTRDAEQMLGVGVAPVTERRTGTFRGVTASIDGRFVPTISTEVPDRYATNAGEFSDLVTIGTAPGAPWPTVSSTGRTMPVVADGVLYGPFLSPQSEAAAPPSGAPIADRSRIDVDRGPGTYSVRSAAAAREAGYYYWVWSIREEAQSREVRDSRLLAEGSEVTDRFGLRAESQVVATSLEWETQLIRTELTLDDRTLDDRIRARLRHGGWLRDEQGRRVPARIRMTIFAEASQPERAVSAPDGARVLGSYTVDVSETHTWIDAEPFEVPFETRGWVTVQACLRAEDQSDEVRGMLAEWCDDYGVPAESAQIVLPEVRTEAVPAAIVGDAIWDRAIVRGPVPREAELTFTFYLEPEVGAPKYSADWVPVRDADGVPILWSAEEIEAMEASERCLAQPVASLDPVELVGAGEVVSAPVVARSAGTGYWVERLMMLHPDSGEPVTLHEGACGIENERTVVSLPAPPAIARTGGPAIPALAAGAFGLLVLGGATFGISRARGRNSR